MGTVSFLPRQTKKTTTRDLKATPLVLPAVHDDESGSHVSMTGQSDAHSSVMLPQRPTTLFGC